MRWPWRRARQVEPRPAVSTKAMEILAEIFQVRAGEVEEMIQRRAGGEELGCGAIRKAWILAGGARGGALKRKTRFVVVGKSWWR